jgi:5-bromo-4-chloroindolyl phosphate hydrolysis protein
MIKFPVDKSLQRDVNMVFNRAWDIEDVFAAVANTVREEYKNAEVNDVDFSLYAEQLTQVHQSLVQIVEILNKDWVKELTERETNKCWAC